MALRDRFNRLLGENEQLCRSLAVRLSGLGVRYLSPNGSAATLAGQRVPDLPLVDAPAASIYGLLHSAKFVLLCQGPQAGDYREYSDRLDVVTARLAHDPAHPEWSGIRAMLIRPDGYLAWASRESGPDAEPPLANWLG